MVAALANMARLLIDAGDGALRDTFIDLGNALESQGDIIGDLVFLVA
jgi:hypothetical protein